jgi:hypothetical protein
MDKELTGVAAFVCSIFILTCFSPFAYGFNTQQYQPVEKPGNAPSDKQATTLQMYRTNVGKSDCGVRTISLNATDYITLINRTERIKFDAFGNSETQKKNDALEEADVSSDSTVMTAKNQFITGPDGKPVGVFDLMQNRLVSPDAVGQCHLSNLVTSGYMSYATLVDQNTRFCAQYPDTSCESGHPSSETTTSVTSKLDKVKEVQSMMNSALNNKLTAAIVWNQVKPKLEEIQPGSTDKYQVEINNALATGDLGKVKDVTTDAISDVVAAAQADTSYSPLNFFESDDTTAYFTGADKVFMFPFALSDFTQKLAKLQEQEQLITWANLATTFMTVGSLARQWQAAKLLKSGMSPEYCAKHNKGCASIVEGMEKETRQIAENTGKMTEAQLKQTANAKGWVFFDTDKVTDFKQAKKLYEEALTNRMSPKGMEALFAEADDAANDAAKIEKLRTMVDDEGIKTIDYALMKGEKETEALARVVRKELSDKADELAKIKNGLKAINPKADGAAKEVEGLLSQTTGKQHSLRSELIRSLEKGRTETAAKLAGTTDTTKQAEYAAELGHYDTAISAAKAKDATVYSRLIREDTSANALIMNAMEKSGSVKLSSLASANIDDMLVGLERGSPNTLRELMQEAAYREYYGADIAKYIAGKGAIMSNLEIATKGGRFWQLYGAVQLAAIKTITGTSNILRIGRLQALITFSIIAYAGEPKAIYELNMLELHMTPASKLPSNDHTAYFDILVTKEVPRSWDYDLTKTNLFTNLAKWFGVDFKDIFGEGLDGVMRKKMQAVSPFVMVVDQETGVTTLSPTTPAMNMILPMVDQANKKKWSFLSTDPDPLKYYTFEHPAGYALYKGTKYTTMALFVNNVNMSGLTSVEADWAKIPFSALIDALPNWQEFLTTAALGGLVGGFGAGAAVGGGVMRSSIFSMGYAVLLKQFGQAGTAMAKEMASDKYGVLVDIDKAYSSGKQCSQVEREALAKIEPLLNYKWATAGATMGLELINFYTAGGAGIGAIALAATQITLGVADWYVTTEYEKAKAEGLDAMKSCYETQFFILGSAGIPTEGGTTDEITKTLKSGAETAAQYLGPTLKDLSPEAYTALKNIGNTFYYNTMTFSGDITKASMSSIAGSEIYYVHFDMDSDIKWFLPPECPFELCDYVDGAYKCMMAQGYMLFDSDGNMIFEGPQVLGLHWNNMLGFAGIPQKVVEVDKKSGTALLDMYKDSVRFVEPDNCTRNEFVKLLGLKSSTSDIQEAALADSFGRLEVISTPEAYIMYESGFDTVAVRYLTDSSKNVQGCPGKGKIVRYAGNIRLYRDGTVRIVDPSGVPVSNCTNFDLGQSGFISFENGKIIPGKAQPAGGITNKGRTYTYSTSRENVLHMFTYKIIENDVKDMDDLSVLEPCTVDGQTGFRMKTSMSDSTMNAQWNELLNDTDDEGICFTQWIGPDDTGRADISDNTLRITDADNVTKDYQMVLDPVTGLPMYDSERGCIRVRDSKTGEEYCMKTEIGPDGVPQMILLDKNGNPYGSPIPLLWANGMGGSMMYNPDSGRISINNEFPFAINPNFQNYGAGGLGLMKPESAPWGSRVKQEGGGGVVEPPANPLAALPWAPAGADIIAFSIAMAAGLMLIRMRYNKKGRRKR